MLTCGGKACLILVHSIWLGMTWVKNSSRRWESWLQAEMIVSTTLCTARTRSWKLKHNTKSQQNHRESLKILLCIGHAKKICKIRSRCFLIYLLMSREGVRICLFTQMAAVYKKPPSLTLCSELCANDWTPAMHTLHSLCKRASFKVRHTMIISIYKYMFVGLCKNLPDRWLCVWSWAVSWKTVSKSSSADSSKKQSCTEEKNVKVTSQMKEISGSMLPESDRLLISDRVTWSFSNIFSMYISPIRGSGKQNLKKWFWWCKKIQKICTSLDRKQYLPMCICFTIVVVLRENQADKHPTVVTWRGGRNGRAAFHLA